MRVGRGCAPLPGDPRLMLVVMRWCLMHLTRRLCANGMRGGWTADGVARLHVSSVN